MANFVCESHLAGSQVHLDGVSTKLADLLALERSLSKFVTACTEQGAGGPAPKCNILQDLRLSDADLVEKSAAPIPNRCCG